MGECQGVSTDEAGRFSSLFQPVLLFFVYFMYWASDKTPIMHFRAKKGLHTITVRECHGRKSVGLGTGRSNYCSSSTTELAA